MSRLARLLTLILALALPAWAAAQDGALPQWQHTSVNDFADLLGDDDTRRLDQALIDLHDATGVQGTVVTIADRARYGGTDGLESFVTRLFNAWGVGDRSRNDGFMVLLSQRDHEARIELGRGYPREADLLAQDIMDRVMVPSFREGDYGRGLREGTLAVIDRIARPHAAGQAVERPRGRSDWSGFGLFLALSAGMFALHRRNRRRQNRCPSCGHEGLERTTVPLRENLPGGGWRTASGTVTRRCPACGWQAQGTTALPVITYYNPMGQVERTRSARTVRGSSGFGGGSSRGGGASGHW